MEIKVYQRSAEKYAVEKVYGQNFLNWLYDSPSGRMASPFLKNKIPSKLYGYWMDHKSSRKKIDSFLEEHPMDLSPFVKPSASKQGWDSFNDFFIRSYKEGYAKFSQYDQMPAYAEGRYFAWESLDRLTTVPVKGYQLNRKQLLENRHMDPLFKDGPAMVCRLAPVDYHRFHFMDDGEVVDSWRILGDLDSVNPLSLSKNPGVHMENERQVTILSTKRFGTIAMIEVGAICVGKIVQTYTGDSFNRGQEKGYFKFGGSTVIILGEKGAWKPSQDILDQSAKGFETLIGLGDPIAEVKREGLL